MTEEKNLSKKIEKLSKEVKKPKEKTRKNEYGKKERRIFDGDWHSRGHSWMTRQYRDH